LVDLDGDGRQDILSGSWPGEIYLFRRQADGAFAPGKVLTDAKGKEINVGSAAAVFAVDWDADGDLDLLVGTISGSVHILSNGGSRRAPAFGDAVKIELPGQDQQMSDSAPVAADWDGDGRLDLLIATGEGSVSFYRNVGTARAPRLSKGIELIGPSPGTAQDDRRRNAGEWGQRAKICVTDWDGDGRLDILLGDLCGNYTAKPNQSPAERAAERLAI
jgi:FG-GAP-like repeat